MADRAEAPPPAEQPYPPERYCWYIVSVLMVIYIFSFTDRQILSLMVDDLKEGLDLEYDWQAGVLMGPAFGVCYALFGVLFGRLADSRGRKGLIAFGLMVWSLLTAGCGFARNFVQMALLRVGVGIGEATLSPSAYSIIADCFRKERIGTAIGFYTMGIYFGAGAAYLIGGPAVDYVRKTLPWHLPVLGEVAPWQKVFLMVGLPGLLMLPVLLLTVKEPARRGLLRSSVGKGSIAVPFSQVAAYFRLNWKTMFCHNLGFAMLSFSNYGTGAWVPSMFKRVHEWDAAQFGLIYGTVVFVAGSLGIFTGGWFADILRRRGSSDAKMRIGFIASWIWFPFGIVYPLVGNAWVSMAFLVGSVYTSSMPHGVAPAAMQEIMPNNMRGQASAIYLLIVNFIGLGVGPLLTGALTDYVFSEQNYGVEGVRYSLLSLTLVAHTVSTVLLWKGMAYYKQSLKRLEELTA